MDQTRVGTVLFGKALLRDRDEEEVRGYCQALDFIYLSDQDKAKLLQDIHLAPAWIGDLMRKVAQPGGS